ncbi:MAG TPA: hypothetical protein PK887_07360 [Ignavibacteriales bacterium]|nr:hypothetical protein [Ignavibacteriales bacterium]
MDNSLQKILQENFKVIISDRNDILVRIKNYSNFHKYGYFEKYSLFFIKYDELPLFMLSKHKLIDSIGTKIELKQPEDPTTIISLKEAFATWILTKSDEKKKIYADLILSLNDDEKYKDNIDLPFITAIIKIYDLRVYDTNSIYILNDIIEKVTNDSENRLGLQNRSQFITLLNICKGFAAIKHNNFIDAKKYFETALELNRNEITAKFYILYCDILEGQDEKAIELFIFALNFDVNIIVNALENEVLEPIKFHLQNCLLYEIFYHAELDKFSSIFIELISQDRQKYEIIFSLIDKAMKDLQDGNFNQYYNDRINSILLYIDSYIYNFRNSQNIIILRATVYLGKLFEKIKEQIIENYKETLLNKVATRLHPLNHQIEVKNKSIVDLSNLQREEINNLKNEKELKIIEKDKEIDRMILKYENDLSEMDLLTKYNPKLVFTNSMVYTFIVSMIVFIMVNFYQCSGVNGDFTNISGALQAGLATFVIGIIFASVMGVISYFDKMIMERKLKFNINNLQSNRGRIIDNLRDEYDKKIKEKEEFYTNKIEKLKKEIQELTERKKQLIEETLKANQQHIEELNNKLNQILKLSS